MKSAALLLLFAVPGVFGDPRATAQPAATGDKGVTALVERLARIGRASSPTFSPDGKHVALVSDLSGVPQIWIVPAGGGWPRLVTAGDDPVGVVVWSPAGDWLAFTVLPGGGLNSQIYRTRGAWTWWPS